MTVRRAIRLRFWLTAMDLCHRIGWPPGYLFCVRRASDVEWEDYCD